MWSSPSARQSLKNNPPAKADSQVSFSTWKQYRPNGSIFGGSVSNKVDRSHTIHHLPDYSSRVNSLHGTDEDKASSCNSNASKLTYSNKSQASVKSSNSVSKLLRNMKQDAEEAAYEGCLMDGPLGPAITEKEQKQRKLLILGISVAAFIIILCLALKEIGYNNGLTKLIESKAKEEAQLERIKEEILKNKLNKISSILTERENQLLQPELDSGGGTYHSNLDLNLNAQLPRGNLAVDNQEQLTNLEQNIAQTEQSLENLQNQINQVSRPQPPNLPFWNPTGWNWPSLPFFTNTNQNMGPPNLPGSPPLMVNPAVGVNPVQLTTPEPIPIQATSPLEVQAAVALPKAEAQIGYRLQTPRPSASLESQVKVQQNMAELSTMLETFLDELYDLIEKFLQNSNQLSQEANPDLAALFLAKQEKQIRNLMQGEEQHLQKRFQDIAIKTRERAFKMHKKIGDKAISDVENSGSSLASAKSGSSSDLEINHSSDIPDPQLAAQMKLIEQHIESILEKKIKSLTSSTDESNSQEPSWSILDNSEIDDKFNEKSTPILIDFDQSPEFPENAEEGESKPRLETEAEKQSLEILADAEVDAKILSAKIKDKNKNLNRKGRRFMTFRGKNS